MSHKSYYKELESLKLRYIAQLFSGELKYNVDKLRLMDEIIRINGELWELENVNKKEVA